MSEKGWSTDVAEQLAAPFADEEISFLPRGIAGGKAQALPYIESRCVMRRLDAVVGPGNWSFDFELLSPDGRMVKGSLTVLGVTHSDAGEASGEDERLKAAVSDALKRCAVHFGIGRYLHDLPRILVPYDNQRRQFTEQPRYSSEMVSRAASIGRPVRTVRPETPAEAATNGAAPQRTPPPPPYQPGPRNSGRSASTEHGEVPAASRFPSRPTIVRSAEPRQSAPARTSARG